MTELRTDPPDEEIPETCPHEDTYYENRTMRECTICGRWEKVDYIPPTVEQMVDEIDEYYKSLAEPENNDGDILFAARQYIVNAEATIADLSQKLAAVPDEWTTVTRFVHRAKLRMEAGESNAIKAINDELQVLTDARFFGLVAEAQKAAKVRRNGFAATEYAGLACEAKCDECKAETCAVRGAHAVHCCAGCF